MQAIALKFGFSTSRFAFRGGLHKICLSGCSNTDFQSPCPSQGANIHETRYRSVARAGECGFALAVLALGGFGLYQVASRRWRVQPTFHVRARFATIAGVEPGHRVRLQGVDAGAVEEVIAPQAPGEPVELILRLDQHLHHLVRTDAVARILSEGMVGARVVEITPGEPGTAMVAEGEAILTEPPIELSDLMKKTRESLHKLDELAKSAETGLEEINAIARSIREGKGSLGKLVRDDDAYDNLLSLTRRGERTVSAMEDNLAAVKHTWPLSRYFDARSYFDREKVLYQPGSRRDSRTFSADDLFEPDRAILTPVGRTRLDAVARWCKKSSQSRSEVVIAAFTDDGHDQDLAELLTQEQADAVRKYLIDKHGIDSAGWFRSRKVAAVGFGTQVPRGQDASAAQLPAQGRHHPVHAPDLRGSDRGTRIAGRRAETHRGKRHQPRGRAGRRADGGGNRRNPGRAGITTALVDVNPDALESATQRVRQLVAKGPRSASVEDNDVDLLLRTSTKLDTLADCDVVIEAVIEDETVKTAMFRALAEVLRAPAIVASNTSTIPISRMALAWPYPEHFAGMHFFHPVHRMELVEVIRGERTSDETIATLRALARQLSKTAIVVKDGPGFLTTRVLYPYVSQAISMLQEGASMERIDAAAERFGMAMGPIALLDLVGLDTALGIAKVMAGAFPDRFAVPPLLADLVALGRLGRKSGAGFRTYNDPRSPGVVDPAFERIVARHRVARTPPDEDEMTDRLFLSMLLESIRVLDEGIVGSPADIDRGVVLGLGFPAARGGILSWCDQRGAGEILSCLRRHEPLGRSLSSARPAGSEGQRRGDIPR